MDIFQTLVDLDHRLFLFLNGFQHPVADVFMFTYTGTWIWLPMYATIVFVLFRNFHWKKATLCVLAIGLTIVFADQLTATFIRPWLERPRPSNPASPVFELANILHPRGGYGFPSAHASNSFGLVVFLIYLFRNKALSIFITLWALINCYTRIDLGVHYPGDLAAGTLVGIAGASLMYFLLGKLTPVKEFRQAKHTNLIIWVGLATVAYIIVYTAVKACF